MSDFVPQGAPPAGYQTASPYLLYEDADRAVAYLTRVFGFTERRVTTGAAGRNRRLTATDPEGHVWVFAQRVGAST